jgi:hypothetical protein
MYSVPFDNLSVTNDADQDIIELVNASTIVARLHEIQIYSATTTDERVRFRLVRRSTTGSGGTACTEVALDEGNTVAAAVAVNQLVLTPGTVGAFLKAWYWSQLSPLVYLPTPEERGEIKPSGRLCLNLETAVASTRNWSGFVVWEECGG